MILNPAAEWSDSRHWFDLGEGLLYVLIQPSSVLTCFSRRSGDMKHFRTFAWHYATIAILPELMSNASISCMGSRLSLDSQDPAEVKNIIDIY